MSFTTTLNIMLWKSTRAPADADGGKGYNVYKAAIGWHGSEMIVNIAHMTVQAPYYPGTLARVTADANLHERSLLLVAFRLVPAPVQPIIGVQPSLFHLLPRVDVTGIVASVEGPSILNSNSIEFTVTVSRKMTFPVQELLLACATTRDDDRLTLHKPLVVGMPIKFTGVVCGWSRHDTVLIDVYTLAKNNIGPMSPVWACEKPNPFEHAIFPDGYAKFPAALFATARRPRGYDVYSRHAPPTRIARRYNVTPDPRRRLDPTPEPVARPAAPSPDDAMVVDGEAPHKKTDLANLVSGWPPAAEPRSTASPAGSTVSDSESDVDDNVSSTAVVGDDAAASALLDLALTEQNRATASTPVASSSAASATLKAAARDAEAFLSVQDVRDGLVGEAASVRGTKRRRKTSLTTPRKVILRVPGVDVAA
ncbi:hypothetical protein AURDEDRAFT_130050 [Auricularia subglabra TFB-10046 SS5]|uniref:Uncharacterized protein n=1 Tax=Auricularia subglabra (strain TFB-10046 / SS5) TaxID=717982 RepID=J0LG48_AURST|nr:hypothetical protein AURDEDRAFT_130050 [Auricularia subglabra TFB-10046 SS5]